MEGDGYTYHADTVHLPIDGSGDRHGVWWSVTITLYHMDTVHKFIISGWASSMGLITKTGVGHLVGYKIESLYEKKHTY